MIDMKLKDFPVINEIRMEYEHLRQTGYSRAKTISILQENYQNELSFGAADDGLLFWIGIADAQYSFKELSITVSKNALVALDVLEQKNWSISPCDINRRRQNYCVAPMEERQTFKKSRKFRCTWKLGDTFAYLLEGSDAKVSGIAGRFVLLRKVDELEFGDGRLLPIVTLTLWDDQPLPSRTDEYQRLPLLRLACGRMDFARNKYEYRAEMLFTTKKKLNELSLLYVGNFLDAKMPDNEVTVRHPAKVLMILPDQLEKDCCLFWKRHNSYSTRNQD